MAAAWGKLSLSAEGALTDGAGEGVILAISNYTSVGNVSKKNVTSCAGG